MDHYPNNDEILLALQVIMSSTVTFLIFFLEYYNSRKHLRSGILRTTVMRKYNMLSRIPKQIDRLQDIIDISDVDCINNLRMNRNAFGRLCHLVEHIGGLVSNRNINVSAQLAIFLSVLAHHKKNCIVGHDYVRSGRIVSKHFHGVLNAILKLHTILLMQSMPVDEDCMNEMWKWFKGCLGALDGTYIYVRVPMLEKGRYRNRESDIAMNVLGVCDRDMKFIYLLSGWEGSAADSRVLRNAVTRDSGLRVPRGTYYLCDNEYTNDDVFLSPYRGLRYHLDDWDEGNSRPRNKEDFFNMKHSKARNVSKRAFWITEKKVQSRIIIACALIHNFIRTEMPIDPLEYLIVENQDRHGLDDDDYVDIVESTSEWST
ncbi:hypothetical protein Pfo_025773 [Paulownia fortunei]|nr:hypothetical protein Pfo_025773 [Paulownia fortunei]